MNECWSNKTASLQKENAGVTRLHLFKKKFEKSLEQILRQIFEQKF